MKNKIIKIVQGIIIILVIFLILGICGYIETHYTMECRVTDTQGDKIKIKDSVGQTFVFYGQGYEVDDKVKVTFENNCTDNIRKDDKVVKIKGL